MASYPDTGWGTVFDQGYEQYGAWDNSADMRRSDSQSTSYTVDSTYTTSTSGYSSITDYSVIDPALAADGSWHRSLSCSNQPFDELPDASHVLSATGSQYQQSGQQLPQTLQLSGPLQPFDTSQKGIEAAARQATLAANVNIINNQQPFPDAGPLFISFEAVDEALHWRQEQDGEESARPAVQAVLYQQLYPRLTDMEHCGADIPRILEEAAYQLQIRLQGAEVLDICFYAIVNTLVQLSWELGIGANEVSLDSVEPHRPRSPVTRGPAEKGKFKCDYPGCPKTASRHADLERHYKIGHLDEDQKTKHLCDYKKCGRHTNPFLRQDHFRDHLRIYHKEDLVPRGKGVDGEWWATRAPRAVFNGWWRCSKCLMRVGLDKYGFVCPGCRHPCEKERQRYRVKRGGGSVPV